MDINVIDRLKKDTNGSEDIVYRDLIICNNSVHIIYNEPLISSNVISDFVIRCLDRINSKYDCNSDLEMVIFNEIDNVKINKIYSYEDICFYINNGFTIILIEGYDVYFAIETRRNLARGISNPLTENTLRGSMDSFVEDIQTNMGLIRKRIRDNNLWVKSYYVGRYTKTKVCMLFINKIVNNSLVKYIDSKIKKIDIDGIISSGTIKNLIERENKSVFPTIISTERPDRACEALLQGRIVIVVDNSQYVLILPITFNDLFISVEDDFSKSINVSMTRVIRYLSFFLTLLIPSLYLALITYNQDMLSEKLLISFAKQRIDVPFPAFLEAIMMMLSFEILRECDLRSPNFTTSAMSTVGALILGSAAVDAGIVSPIMIIIISLTALSSLLFTEPEMINGIRWYRLLFMLSASLMGIVGIFFAFIYLVIKLCSLNSFTVPYLVPFSPLSISGIKNSIIKFPIKCLNKRSKFFSNDTIKYSEVKK